MKSRRLSITSFAFAALALCLCARAADTGYTSLFNGHDLTGWSGLPEFWSVRDGAITGQTTAEKVLKANTFLVWQGGDVKNFELRLRFKLTGENDKAFANSGVQYRSRVIDPATFVVGGYQADMDLGGKYIGMLYEEKGRGILMQPGQRIRIGAMGDAKKAPVEQAGPATDAAHLTAAYRKNDWNELRIVADGNHLQHFLNGTPTADVIDDDTVKGAKSGVLALQLHTGGAMTVQFKDIQLKTLP